VPLLADFRGYDTALVPLWAVFIDGQTLKRSGRLNESVEVLLINFVIFLVGMTERYKEIYRGNFWGNLKVSEHEKNKKTTCYRYG
jgi:hypothetical protein